MKEEEEEEGRDRIAEREIRGGRGKDRGGGRSRMSRGRRERQSTG